MMAFYGITGFSSFLSILDRVGDVLQLDEVQITRDTSGEARVSMENCSFSWGFKVSENQKEA